MDKKKLLALLIFLIMGFFMITWANPSDELYKIDTDETSDNTKETSDVIAETDNTKKLSPLKDDDKDHYTNEEELANGSDPEDDDSVPKYDYAPSIDTSLCQTDITVYSDHIDFSACAKATDEFYGTNGVSLSVDDTKIDYDNIGDYIVTFTATDNLNNKTVVELTVHVTKRDILVTIDNKSSIYLADLEVLTSNVNDVIYNGHDLGLSLTTDATKGSDVGTYSILASYTNKNYNATFIDGTYEITKKELTKDDFSHSSKDVKVVYDGKSHSIVAKTDTKKATISYSDNNALTDVGKNEVTVTFTGIGNYTGVVIETANLEVTPKEVRVVWDDADSLVYDGTDKTPTAYIDNVNHSASIRLDVTLDGVSEAINAGKYKANASLNDSNYKLINTTHEFTITKKTLTDDDLKNIAFNNSEVTYDGKSHSIMVTNAPDYVNVTYKNNGQVNAKTYIITATVTAKEDSNYTGSVEFTATLTINPKNVTIDWDNTLFTYDGEAHKPSASYTDVNGATIDLDVTGEKINAGSYTATTTVKDGNYKASNLTTEFTIGKKTLTENDFDHSITGYNAQYDGKSHSVTANCDSTKATISYSDNNALTDVGKNEVTVTFTGIGNYTGMVTVKENIIIIQKEVTIDWANTLFTYDGEAHKPSASYKDVNGATIDLDVDGEQINAGSYTATTTVKDGNYKASNLTTEFTIGKKTLTENDFDHSVTGYNAQYDGESHSVTANCDSTKATISYSDNNALTDVGKNEVTVTFTGIGNYTGTVIVKENIVITQRDVTIDWADTSFTYDGEAHKPSASYKDVNGATIDLDVTGEKINVGSYTATTIVNDKNYTASNTTHEFTIGKKTLSKEDLGNIVFNNCEVTYDGKSHSIMVTNAPDYVNVSYENNGKVDAGTYTITATVTAKENSNYTGSVELAAKLTINPKNVTIDWANTSFTFDGEAHKPSASYEDINNNKVILVVTGEATDAGSHTAVTSITDSNYVASNTTHEFTIGKKTLSKEDLGNIVFNNGEVTYDGNSHSIMVTNAPDYVDVYYENNGKVDAGTYDVTAIVTAKEDSNYTGSVEFTATLTINPKNVTIDWDNTLFTYDGEAHKPSASYTDINGATIDLDVTGEKINVGSYTAKTTITDKNYNASNLTCEFTIGKKTLTDDDIKDIVFKDLTVTYDGKSHSIMATNVPDYVGVTYSNNGQVNVGTYTITATVTAKENSNYTGSKILTATLTINPMTVKIDWANTSFTYDGDAHKPSASYKDINNNKVILVVTGEATDVGTHEATTTITDKNYVASNLTCEFTIGKKTLTDDDIKDILFKDLTVTYDGESHSIIATNVPDYVDVTYDKSDLVNAKTYTITATVTAKENSNYTGSKTLTATLIINKAKVSVVWTDADSLVYDNTNKVPTAKAVGVNNEDIALNVTPNTAIKAGEYTAKATTSNDNYTLENAAHKFTIIKADPSYVIPTGLSMFEDETLRSISLPSGFTFEKDLDKKFSAGTITTTVKYTPTDTDNYNTITGIEVTVEVKKRYYNVRFFDYYNKQIGKTQSVRVGTSATAPTTGFATEITLSNGTVLDHPTWDKDYSKVTGNLDVYVTYESVASAYTTAYLLKDGASIPDPIYAPNDSWNYDKGVDNVQIKDDATGNLAKVVAAAKKSSTGEAYLAVGNDVYNYITETGLAKINDLTGNNYTIVWYVLKYNTGDGWHLDGYRSYK